MLKIQCCTEDVKKTACQSCDKTLSPQVREEKANRENQKTNSFFQKDAPYKKTRTQNPFRALRARPSPFPTMKNAPKILCARSARDSYENAPPLRSKLRKKPDVSSPNLEKEQKTKNNSYSQPRATCRTWASRHGTWIARCRCKMCTQDARGGMQAAGL